MVLNRDRITVWFFGLQIISCTRVRYVRGGITIVNEDRRTLNDKGLERIDRDLLTKSNNMTLGCTKRALVPRTMGLIGPRLCESQTLLGVRGPF